MTGGGGWEIVEHTADAGVRAWGDTPAAALSRAVLGMLALIVPPGQVRSHRAWTVTVEASDPDLLLFNLLDEVLYLHHVEGLLAHAAEVTVTGPTGPEGEAGGGWRARAVVSGETLDPGRHRPGTEIKAVTLHGIALRPQDGGWVARAVFDL